MMATSPGAVAAVFAALYVAHQVADHWVQSQHQADTKGTSGWRGRLACAGHVATYTATALLAVVALAWRTGLTLTPATLAAGLAVSAVTHYIADRRTPLRVIADHVGKSVFYRLNTAGMNGAYLLDQSWHIGWLFVAALVIGGAS
jgi:hypothetical protein